MMGSSDLLHPFPAPHLKLYMYI